MVSQSGTWFDLKDEAEFEAAKKGESAHRQPGTTASPIQFMGQPGVFLRLQLTLPL